VSEYEHEQLSGQSLCLLVFVNRKQNKPLLLRNCCSINNLISSGAFVFAYYEGEGEEPQKDHKKWNFVE